jgi:hypothetical protein
MSFVQRVKKNSVLPAKSLFWFLLPSHLFYSFSLSLGSQSTQPAWIFILLKSWRWRRHVLAKRRYLYLQNHTMLQPINPLTHSMWLINLFIYLFDLRFYKNVFTIERGVTYQKNWTLTSSVAFVSGTTKYAIMESGSYVCSWSSRLSFDTFETGFLLHII